MNSISIALVASAFAVCCLAQPPAPSGCTGTPVGPYAYVIVGSDGSVPGYTISLIDVGQGCRNSTIYADSTYYQDSYSAIACYPGGDEEFTYTTRSQPGGGTHYWTTFNHGTVSRMQDHVSVVKLAYSTTYGQSVNLYSTGGTQYRVGAINPINGAGKIVMTFNIQNGYSFNNIAAWDDANDIWYAIAYNQYTQDSITYVINVKSQSVQSHSFDGVVPVDMAWDSTSGNVYFIYAEGGINQCHQNFVPPRPTNPRTHHLSVATVATDGSIDPVAGLYFEDCLRFHAISTWDSEHQRYIFYAQRDISSSNYQNGIGYVDFGTKPTGNITAVIGGYWGNGIGLAAYTMCPATN